MSQLIKVLQVLDLFSEQRTTLRAEEIADLLGLSRPTAFRYARQLCAAGLLSKLSGQYSLGARIIQLDYRIRRSDPLLIASREKMRKLADRTSCTIVLSSLYNDDIINVHHETGRYDAKISLGRGLVMPRFRGAAAKAIVAHLPPARLRRLYQQYANHPNALEIAPDWTGFQRYFRAIRQRGYYVSHGEVDIGITGVAAPIFNADRTVIGALTLVFDCAAEPWIQEERIAAEVVGCASTIRPTASGETLPATLHGPSL